MKFKTLAYLGVLQKEESCSHTPEVEVEAETEVEGRDAHFFSLPSHIVEKLDYDREVIFLFLFCICFVGFLEIDLATSFLYTLFSNQTNTMAWNDFILSVFRTHFTAAILLLLEYFCFLGHKMVKRLKISSFIFIF